MSRVFLPHVITDDSALGGMKIERSLRFNDNDSPRLNRTPSSDGNRRTWTKSFWLKRGQEMRVMIFGVYTSGTDVAAIEFVDNHNFFYYDYLSSYRISLMTNQVFRDQNGWYHFVVAQDTTQSTASDRVKIYVNGSQVTSFSIETYPSQNLDGKFNTGSLLEAIGTEGTNQRLHLDGYMTEINYIDGQQLDSSYFGFTDSQTGIWKPKRYEGTYGTNGYHLEFKDN